MSFTLYLIGTIILVAGIAYVAHLAHVPEHSIELEVVFLQYLHEGKRAFRIVPLLVGSFHDCIQMGGISPANRLDIARMIEALRRAEAEAMPDRKSSERPGSQIDSRATQPLDRQAILLRARGGRGSAFWRQLGANRESPTATVGLTG